MPYSSSTLTVRGSISQAVRASSALFRWKGGAPFTSIQIPSRTSRGPVNSFPSLLVGLSFTR